jgi:hypothetical protein
MLVEHATGERFDLTILFGCYVLFLGCVVCLGELSGCISFAQGYIVDCAESREFCLCGVVSQSQLCLVTTLCCESWSSGLARGSGAKHFLDPCSFPIHGTSAQSRDKPRSNHLWGGRMVSCSAVS